MKQQMLCNFSSVEFSSVQDTIDQHLTVWIRGGGEEFFQNVGGKLLLAQVKDVVFQPIIFFPQFRHIAGDNIELPKDKLQWYNKRNFYSQD